MGILIGSPVGDVALGALAMYFLDPQEGRTRRARLRDQLVRLEHVSEEAAHATRRDVSNRARGLVAELRARLSPETVDDQVLVERVRAKAGRAVSHPHALHIDARAGVVILSGDVLSVEVVPLIARVRAIRGVHGVENHIMVHSDPGEISTLQGGRPAGVKIDWSPGARLLASGAGASLLARGFGVRGLGGVVLGAVGLALVMRGLVNQPIRRWVDRTVRHHPQPGHVPRESGAPAAN
jgi:hypothetical protein